ncbi:MAG: hypothetical protein LBG52_01405 [Candidatus Peribacteria bacterium]|nr:hypothetical protein [Candidatus Peribacteria bacterium]
MHLRFEQRKREENDKQEKEKAQQIERMTHLLESGRISQGRQKIENSGKAQKYMLLKNKED